MTDEEVIKEIENIRRFNYTLAPDEVFDRAISALSENKRDPEIGHWSRKRKVDAYDIAGVKTWGIKCQCDRCCFTTIVVEDFGYYRYCPNCGADMRGE